MEKIFEPDDLIYVYTSKQAVEDGILFDVDTILTKKVPGKDFFLQYITTGLLASGYWNDQCKNGVKDGQQGNNERCATCEDLDTARWRKTQLPTNNPQHTKHHRPTQPSNPHLQEETCRRQLCQRNDRTSVRKKTENLHCSKRNWSIYSNAP